MGPGCPIDPRNPGLPFSPKEEEEEERNKGGETLYFTSHREVFLRVHFLSSGTNGLFK